MGNCLDWNGEDPELSLLQSTPSRTSHTPFHTSWYILGHPPIFLTTSIVTRLLQTKRQINMFALEDQHAPKFALESFVCLELYVPALAAYALKLTSTVQQWLNQWQDV